jgi:hypothetical protein
MKPFDLTDEANPDDDRPASERLEFFTKALWSTLVPPNGACVSVQGELIRASERLQSEYFRNGMANYFRAEAPGAALTTNYYGGLLVFLLDTLLANRSAALSAADVGYFRGVRDALEPQWRRGLRSDELSYKAEEEELTDAEQAELAALDELPRGPAWETMFARVERCVANWCLANRQLVDREGRPVVEGGVSDLIQIFEPAPAAVVCERCGGKGWLPPQTAGAFPAVCACRT